MAAIRQFRVSRISQIVLGLTIAKGLCAAVAAAPSKQTLGPNIMGSVTVEPTLNEAPRPFGKGPVMKIGRAFGPEDEDCVTVITERADANGKLHAVRQLSCAN
jgi:hypothetical protein